MLHPSAWRSRESRRQTSLPFVPRPWTAKARDPRQSRSRHELSGVQRGVLANDREHADLLTGLRTIQNMLHLIHAATFCDEDRYLVLICI